MTFLVSLFVGLTTMFCVGLNDPGKNPGKYQDSVLNQLKPDCYYNWAIYDTKNLDNPKFDPMLWYITDGTINQATTLAKTYKGRLWFVYNEPEVSTQSNVDAITAASWFDKTYESIKKADPTATVLCCGNMISGQGIDWLNVFIKTVKNKPDAWHVHLYIATNNFNDWKSFIDYWWYWNTDKLPTYITETCGMYADSQVSLLKDVLKYQHPLLKRVYWFSAYPEPQVANWKCNLLNNQGQQTAIGQVFATRSNPTKLTPIPEPPTATPTKTPIPPTITPTATATKIPTNTPTPVPTIDETTGEGETNEPHQIKIYMPLIQQ